MDRLQALEAFVGVVEAGNFSRAAEHLGWPRPTVTRLVKTLEADLQATLLHRTTRRVNLTAEGQRVYDRARGLLADYSALQDDTASGRTAPRGRVRVEMASAIAVHAIAPALPEFRARYPQIDLHLSVNNRSADLIDRSTDCVIRIGEILDEGLIARPARALALILVASPDYLARHGTPREPSDTERHEQIQIISPRTRRIIAHPLRRNGAEARFGGTRVLSVDDANAVVAAAIAGLGLARTYTFLARQPVADGRLVQVLPDWQAGSVPVRLAYPADRKPPRRVRAFVEWAEPLLEALSDTQAVPR